MTRRFAIAALLFYSSASHCGIFSNIVDDCILNDTPDFGTCVGKKIYSSTKNAVESGVESHVESSLKHRFPDRYEPVKKVKETYGFLSRKLEEGADLIKDGISGNMSAEEFGRRRDDYLSNFLLGATEKAEQFTFGNSYIKKVRNKAEEVRKMGERAGRFIDKTQEMFSGTPNDYRSDVEVSKSVDRTDYEHRLEDSLSASPPEIMLGEGQKPTSPKIEQGDFQLSYDLDDMQSTTQDIFTDEDEIFRDDTDNDYGDIWIDDNRSDPYTNSGLSKDDFSISSSFSNITNDEGIGVIDIDYYESGEWILDNGGTLPIGVVDINGYSDESWEVKTGTEDIGVTRLEDEGFSGLDDEISDILNDSLDEKSKTLASMSNKHAGLDHVSKGDLASYKSYSKNSLFELSLNTFQRYDQAINEGKSNPYEFYGQIYKSSGSDYSSCTPLPPKCKRQSDISIRKIKEYEHRISQGGLYAGAKANYCALKIGVDINRLCGREYQSLGKSVCAQASRDQVAVYLEKMEQSKKAYRSMSASPATTIRCE